MNPPYLLGHTTLGSGCGWTHPSSITCKPLNDWDLMLPAGSEPHYWTYIQEQRTPVRMQKWSWWPQEAVAVKKGGGENIPTNRKKRAIRKCGASVLMMKWVCGRGLNRTALLLSIHRLEQSPKGTSLVLLLCMECGRRKEVMQIMRTLKEGLEPWEATGTIVNAMYTLYHLIPQLPYESWWLTPVTDEENGILQG